jgi:hypothetical protein
MIEKYQKIKDSASLVRDTTTGAVLNKDRSGYQDYIDTYNKLKKQEEEFESLKHDVKTLSSDISDIKNLLTTLIREKNDDN